MSDWQPIETAPEETSIQVFHPEGGVCESFLPAIGGNLDNSWHCLDGTTGHVTTFLSAPTHWKPMSAPPGKAEDCCQQEVAAERERWARWHDERARELRTEITERGTLFSGTSAELEMAAWAHEHECRAVHLREGGA